MNFTFTGTRRTEKGPGPFFPFRPGGAKEILGGPTNLRGAQGPALRRDGPVAASQPCPHVKGSRRSIPRHAAGLFPFAGSRPVQAGRPASCSGGFPCLPASFHHSITLPLVNPGNLRNLRPRTLNVGLHL